MEKRALVIGRLKEAATLLGISGDWAGAEAFVLASEAVEREGPGEGLDAWLREKVAKTLSANGELAWAEALDSSLGRRSGTVERLRRGLPPDVVKLLRIRGMSPQRISLAWREHGVDGLESLKRALGTGRLVESGILDEETAKELPRVIREYEAGCAGWLRPEARRMAASLGGHLRSCPLAECVAWVGEAAMGVEVVSSLEILIATLHPEAMEHWLAQCPWLVSGLVERDKGWELRCEGNIRCRVWTCKPEQFVMESYRLCSAPEHWSRLCEVAEQQGLRLEEGTIWRLGEHGPMRVPVCDQREFLRVLELGFIEPELRWGRGEIDLAISGTLPQLVTTADLRGDLHSHSRFSDGTCDPEVLLDAARERGYEYFGISDHTESTWMGGGMRVKEAAEYVAHLRGVSARRKDVRLLVGLEVDILRDGALDMPDEVLASLDVVIAAVHSDFHLATGEQMRRIRKAMEHPLVHILAHPSGRLLGKRSSMPVPAGHLVEMARETGTWLEVNGNPERLDIWAEGVEMCRRGGVRVVVSSDAHQADSLAQVEWGVMVARRGGLEAKDLVNSLPLSELTQALCQKRRQRGVLPT